ncbi:MAG: class I SAM-dependent methyltransferase [Bdellovibrionota bacterium]
MNTKPKVDPSTASWEEFNTGCYEILVPENFWMQARAESILRQLRKTGVSTATKAEVLDVGCGRGGFIRQLEVFTNWRITGVDLNQTALANPIPEQSKLESYDILTRDPSKKGKFDHVFLLDVLEHIPDTRGFLDAALFHVKPGAYLTVNVPALPVLFSRFDHVVGHLRRYTKKSLAREFSELDVKIADLRYWGFSLVPLGIARKIVVARMPKEKATRVGLRPPNQFMNNLLGYLLHWEIKLWPSPPLGTSVLVTVKKAD